MEGNRNLNQPYFMIGIGFTTTLYLCNQCQSPITLWVHTLLRRGELYTTFCDKVCQWLAAGRWFSPGTPVSSTNKTDRNNAIEILLKVVLNTITPAQHLNIGGLCRTQMIEKLNEIKILIICTNILLNRNRGYK